MQVECLVHQKLIEAERRRLRREMKALNAPNEPLPPAQHPETRVRKDVNECPACKVHAPCTFHVAMFAYLKAVKQKKVKFMHFIRKVPELVYNPITLEPRQIGVKKELCVLAEFDNYTLEFFLEKGNTRTAYITVKTRDTVEGFVIPTKEAIELLNPIKKEIYPKLRSVGL